MLHRVSDPKYGFFNLDSVQSINPPLSFLALLLTYQYRSFENTKLANLKAGHSPFSC